MGTFLSEEQFSLLFYESELPPGAADVNLDSRAVSDQFDHVIGNRIRCTYRVCQLPTIHDLGQAQVRAKAIERHGARDIIIDPGANGAAVVRRDRSPTGITAALPAFDPGFTLLKVLERAVIAKVVDIVKPAGARPVRPRVGNAKKGRRLSSSWARTAPAKASYSCRAIGEFETRVSRNAHGAADVNLDSQAVANQLTTLSVTESGVRCRAAAPHR